eukprot:tig00000654_g2821.t1
MGRVEVATIGSDHYVIRRNGKKIGTVPQIQHSFEITDVDLDSNAVLEVYAVNGSGLSGPPSYPLSVGLASDAGAGIHLTARPTRVNGCSAKLLWSTPTQASKIWSRFEIFMNGNRIAAAPVGKRGSALNTFSVHSVPPIATFQAN